MSGVNKVIILGRIGQEPEIKTLDSGDKVANMSVATSESYTNKQGQKVENTEWHNIEIWGKLAGIVEQYLHKGDQVYIEGKLKTESWENQAGEKRYKTKIRGLSLQMLGSKQGQPETTPAPTQQPQQQAPQTTEEESDDLPF
jgi:single-strand DNA-binding protein